MIYYYGTDMFRFLFRLLVIIAIIYAIFHFMPRVWKDKIRGFFSSFIEPVVPVSVRKAIEPYVLSPAERRKRLIAQLDQNLERIKGEVLGAASARTSSGGEPAGAVSGSGPAGTLIEELASSQEILKEIEATNSPNVVQKITSSVMTTITKTLGLAPSESTTTSTVACPE